jgi:hypothetical protein
MRGYPHNAVVSWHERRSHHDDGRTGAIDQSASAGVTYSTRSRMGCRLPCEAWLTWDEPAAQTTTLEEHRRRSVTNVTLRPPRWGRTI